MTSALVRVLLASLACLAPLVVGFASPASAAPPPGWTSVSSGDHHTCGILNRRIYCWGDDTYGQLGDGAAGGHRAKPALIASRATDWTSVSAGGDHTCAIRAGRVACWGYDAYGQLGDGIASGGTPDPTPGLIASGAIDWTSVSAGTNHTCGTRAGRVACWGYDQYGQLGDGNAGGAPDPTPGLIASGATDWKSVSAGGYHTCATRAGRVACWGYDQYGQLGDGNANGGAPDPTPGLIASGATDWKSVSAGGYHTCATRAGRVACWGNDNYGQLGDGNANGGAPDPTPGPIASGATDWKSVDAGGYHTCATRAGRVACWGNDYNGQLGDGTASATNGADPTPGLIASSATDWTSVSAGGKHTCAIRAALACWGNDHYGQLGDGTAGDTPDPIPNLVVP